MLGRYTDLNQLISIIIPVYNAEKYISRCIESLLKQTYNNLEIILVNDSSTDGSLAVCEEYANKDPRVFVYSKDNEGAGLARNYGITKANGILIGFCDADDCVEPDMYERMVNVMNEEKCDLVYCLHVHNFVPVTRTNEKKIFSNEQIWDLAIGEVGTKPENKRDVLYDSAVWGGLYKRTIITDNKIKFLSERTVGSEDLIFNLEYLRYCNRAVRLMDELYRHCDNDQSLTHSKKYYDLNSEIRLYNEIFRVLQSYGQNDFKIELNRCLIKRIRLIVMCIGKATNIYNIIENVREVREIFNDSFIRRIVKTYPGYKLPVKQFVFFVCMRYRIAIAAMLLGKMS